MNLSIRFQTITEWYEEGISIPVHCTECDREFADIRAWDRHLTAKTNKKARACKDPLPPDIKYNEGTGRWHRVEDTTVD